MRVAQKIGHALARISGWKVDIAQPIPPKNIIIGAYHTSNWDLPATLLLKLASGLPIRFIAKASLFWGPFGWIMRRLGGIPLNRETSNDFVATVVDSYQGQDQWMIAISPEGTRSKSSYWRTGFYYIALGADVPIVLGYVDYRLKVVGLGPVMTPSGNLAQDFEIIRAFYETTTPKNPGKQGLVILKPVEKLTQTF